jgi:hypothetical protein
LGSVALACLVWPHTAARRCESCTSSQTKIAFKPVRTTQTNTDRTQQNTYHLAVNNSQPAKCCFPASRVDTYRTLTQYSFKLQTGSERESFLDQQGKECPAPYQRQPTCMFTRRDSARELSWRARQGFRTAGRWATAAGPLAGPCSPGLVYRRYRLPVFL